MPHLALDHNRYLDDAPVDQLHLLEDRILCRVVKKSRNVGRWRIAGQWEYQTKTSIGRVLKLGETYTGPLRVGDYVIFAMWGGREFRSPDETLILLRPYHVEALIDREDS